LLIDKNLFFGKNHDKNLYFFSFVTIKHYLDKDLHFYGFCAIQADCVVCKNKKKHFFVTTVQI